MHGMPEGLRPKTLLVLVLLCLKDDLTVEEQNLLFEILKVRAECLQETHACVSISIRCLPQGNLASKVGGSSIVRRNPYLSDRLKERRKSKQSPR